MCVQRPVQNRNGCKTEYQILYKSKREYALVRWVYLCFYQGHIQRCAEIRLQNPRLHLRAHWDCEVAGILHQTFDPFQTQQTQNFLAF